MLILSTYHLHATSFSIPWLYNIFLKIHHIIYKISWQYIIFVLSVINRTHTISLVVPPIAFDSSSYRGNFSNLWSHTVIAIRINRSSNKGRYWMTIEELIQNKMIKSAKEKAEDNYQKTSHRVANILVELKTLLNKSNPDYRDGWNFDLKIDIVKGQSYLRILPFFY